MAPGQQYGWTANTITGKSGPSAAGLRRGSAPDQDAALTESLLHPAGVDIEAPQQQNPNAPQKRKRPWTSLLGTALVYVWPRSRILQVLPQRPAVVRMRQSDCVLYSGHPRIRGLWHLVWAILCMCRAEHLTAASSPCTVASVDNERK